MIRRLDWPGEGCPAEPVFGCMVETLVACYAPVKDALDCYQSDAGGLLCRFGDRLLLSGRVEGDELGGFVSLCGVQRVETLVGGPGGLTSLGGADWRCRRMALLRYEGPPGPALPSAPETALPAVYDLLRRGDAVFASKAEYLPWLSDLTLRLRRGRARVWLDRDGCSTAAVTSMGCGHAMLASVATHPDHRGEGRASALVLAAAGALVSEGLTPLLVAATPALEGFYARLGFAPFSALEHWSIRQEEGVASYE